MTAVIFWRRVKNKICIKIDALVKSANIVIPANETVSQLFFAYSSYQFFDKRILEKNQQYVMGGKFHAFDGTFPLFRADINPVYGVTAGLNNRSEPY